MDRVDFESSAVGEKGALRLWLRLFATTNVIAAEIAARLRKRFGISLPQFDYLAQLYRSGAADVAMSELSRRLMVTSGNVTGLTDRLERQGWVLRERAAHDRRTQFVRLTAEGPRPLRSDRRRASWLGPGAHRRARPRGAPRALRPARAAQAVGAPREPARHQGGGGMTRMAEHRPATFRWSVEGKVATITLDRPERKNPLTFESYAELQGTFEALRQASDVKAVVITGAGDNFCSGGDVFEIIEPLTRSTMPELLAFTRMTGAVVAAMRACPQPVVAAVDGICAGAGAALAMASDLRIGTPRTRTAFLFVRVGLAGCDMGACALLPRIIGQGRAAELLYTGRAMTAEEGERWGFFNRLVPPETVLAEPRRWPPSSPRAPPSPTP